MPPRPGTDSDSRRLAIALQIELFTPTSSPAPPAADVARSDGSPAATTPTAPAPDDPSPTDPPACSDCGAVRRLYDGRCAPCADRHEATQRRGRRRP